ncbi:nuclear transport factor 2 family protein [Sphingomonas radiodurans]|uniref:nuclear transport factor 2 family protein n=1 Tax=Sphingomonas radiodurans TaxID=2890321 RepID=UPI001E46C0B6|nr:nuclear transport factor 2 family protein [Sphingomonas radiodurans]WBH17765.1 nuclear transport factor 2 family protein [Sphingomonas radiodurans]
MDRIDRLESWHAIYDLVCDYMRGQDRLDAALHRSVFHDDATTDYGDGYRGDADGFVAFAQGVLTPHAANHHMIGQVRIDFEGTDTAFGEVYFQAHHRLVEDGADADLFVAGRYVDRYERRGATWKIAHRSELVDWVRREPATSDGAGFPLGARAPHDLSCRRDEMRVR